MIQKHLKTIRVTLSLLFFIPLTIMFLDFYHLLPIQIINILTYFQFIPSILKFFTFFSFLSIGFLIVLLLTLLFGRVYCSSICPLGVFQDVVNYISQKIKRKKFSYLNDYKKIRYTLMSVAILFIVFGSTFAISLLDPYSNYGRIIGNLIRPLFIESNNIAASVASSFHYYTIYEFEIKAFNYLTFFFSLSVFILVFVMSYNKGRLFCNTICPVGSLLGLISKYSLYRFQIRQQECIECGLCEKKCKAGCISGSEKYIDMNRCISCFNCISACSSGVISYRLSNKRFIKNEIAVDESKREFISSSFSYLFALFVPAFIQKKIIPTKPSTIPVIRKIPISPPGSKSIVHFTSFCTACNLCVSVCPTQVLQPSYLEYGFLDLMKPRLNNYAGFCNFECVLCTNICPTGAILPLNVEEKKVTQVGKVIFVKDNCIVYTERTDCGACSEHCPTKAVDMIREEGHPVLVPVIKDELCVGCGACEYACPTTPYKAIYVEGNEVHQKAKKPEIKEPERIFDYREEFPF